MTRELVLAKLRALILESERDATLAALDRYRADSPAGRARVQLAILKLVAGRAADVPGWVAQAEQDARDVLAPAEYPRQLRFGFTGWSALPQAERERVIAEDRAEYLAWLRA